MTSFAWLTSLHFNRYKASSGLIGAGHAVNSSAGGGNIIRLACPGVACSHSSRRSGGKMTNEREEALLQVPVPFEENLLRL